MRGSADRLVLTAMLLAVAAVVAGCGLLPPNDPMPTPLEGPGPVLLPGAGEAVPAGTSGAAGWTGTADLPNAFDARADHPSPEDVADAFVAALGEAELDVRVYSETPGRVVTLVTETGAGDDAVLGSQYALAIEPRGDSWHLAGLYVRALCRRDVDGDVCV
jgi:hypothetical protein